jgi:hypothetical protein
MKPLTTFFIIYFYKNEATILPQIIGLTKSKKLKLCLHQLFYFGVFLISLKFDIIRNNLITLNLKRYYNISILVVI